MARRGKSFGIRRSCDDVDGIVAAAHDPSAGMNLPHPAFLGPVILLEAAYVDNYLRKCSRLECDVKYLTKLAQVT